LGTLPVPLLTHPLRRRMPDPPHRPAPGNWLCLVPRTRDGSSADFAGRRPFLGARRGLCRQIGFVSHNRPSGVPARLARPPGPVLAHPPEIGFVSHGLARGRPEAGGSRRNPHSSMSRSTGIGFVCTEPRVGRPEALPRRSHRKLALLCRCLSRVKSVLTPFLQSTCPSFALGTNWVCFAQSGSPKAPG